MTYAFLNKASNWVKSITVEKAETRDSEPQHEQVSEAIPKDMFGYSERRGDKTGRPVEGFEGLC